MKKSLSFSSPNDAWILHREEINTARDGICNIYVLLDAYSGFCFGQEISVDLPSSAKVVAILKDARSNSGRWPKQILILKKNPYLEAMRSICSGLGVPLSERPAKELAPFVRTFKDAFRQFMKGNSISEKSPLAEEEQEMADALLPDAYDPCPCASGKNFKACCQNIFKDITFAMCAAQEGRLKESLGHMKNAEQKAGRSAEVVCREAICWSFFDRKKSQSLLREAIEINPHHPRLNYILGIDSAEDERNLDAVKFYETAIEQYPKEDKFHLNETYNNLGTALFQLRKFKEAKDAWEKALVLLPSDRVVKENLIEFIYGNKEVPMELREISPFIERFLNRRPGRR
jgi:tetratricopeptide (TPR) repeat protein